MTQRFEHARIKPEGQPEFEVLFNPNRYSLEKSNQVAEVGVPGLGSPILQFVRGNARTLSMELFFDTYEQQRDVRQHTDRVYALLGIEPERHVPPICTFTWGQFNFRCILERVSGAYTLFLANGTPARATLNVTFKEYIDVEVQVRNPPTQSVDYDKRRQVHLGDTLSSIAADEYGDAGNWRPIALKNKIANPRRLQPGQVLVIPPLV